MAQPKSFGGDLSDHIKRLTEAKPLVRSSIYNLLTPLAIKAIQKGESLDALQSLALPITFKDIEDGSESLTLDALGFLGSLLQFLMLEPELQVSTVTLLTSKLKTVTSKGQSRKLMWSLANIKFDEDLAEEILSQMLNSALLYLGEKPPVHSLSTVCEALNTLKNIGQRNRAFTETKLAAVLSVVFPCLFNEADRIRQLAIECLEPFTETIRQQKLLDSSYQTLLKSTHYNSLMKLVTVEANDCLKIWGFLISAFGTEMQSVSLLNGLLKIEEAALKSRNTEFRQMALEHWQFIIDCFALTPTILNNSKRIHLILVPLKSTETRTENFAATKMHLWWHLLTRLGGDALGRYDEVTSLLLQFCFGSANGNVKANVQIFPNTLPLATGILASVLSPRQNFTVGPLTRSFPLLDGDAFDRSAALLDHCTTLALGLMEAKHGELLAGVCRAYAERCAGDVPRLRRFVASTVQLALNKPVIFDALPLPNSDDSGTALAEALLTSLPEVFLWARNEEPLPTHPLLVFLDKLLAAGLAWNAGQFSTRLLDVLIGSDANSNDLEAGSSSQWTVASELWLLYAARLEGLAENAFCAVDRRSLTMPLAWMTQPLPDGFQDKWRSLLAHWVAADADVLDAVVGAFGADADHRVTRLLIEALSPHGVIIRHMDRVGAVFQKWVASWVNRVDAAGKDTADSEEQLADLILLVNDQPAEVSQPLLLELKTSLQAGASAVVSSPLWNLFDPASASPSPAAAAAPSAPLRRLRALRGLCRMFAACATPRGSASRGRRATKSSDDDFVVIPPTPKTKRILTERQKEVARSKKLNSALPAMYNDLSQDSLTSETQPTLDVAAPPAAAAAPAVPVVVMTNFNTEEEALLEPPSPMKTSTLTAIQELQPTSTTHQSEPLDNPPSIDQLMEKDLKLRSKVSVDVVKLARRGSSDGAAVAAAAAPKPLHDRPAPASVKMARSKLAEDVLSGTANKENNPRRIVLIPVMENNESSRVRSEPRPISDDDEALAVPMEEAQPTVEDVSMEPPQPVNQSVVMEEAEPVDESVAMEEAEPTEIPVAEARPIDEAVVAEPETLVPQPANSESGAPNPPAPAGVSNSVDLFAEPSRSAAPTNSIGLASYKGPLKDHCSKAKTQLLAKDRRRQGQSPSTGKRGAQILELSRKIANNEPPSKKRKSCGVSPVSAASIAAVAVAAPSPTVAPAPTHAAQGPGKTIGSGAAATGTGAATSSTTTPDGSPLRPHPVEPWVRHTYSPYASPSAGILKKKEVDSMLDSSPTSLTKGRRVSFAFPEVSDSVDIPPVTKGRASRTRRSLLHTYKPGEVVVAAAAATPIDFFQEPQPLLPASEETPAEEATPPSSQDAGSQEEASDSAPAVVESDSPVYADLVGCSDPVSAVVQHLASESWRSPMLELLDKSDVRTVGHLSALSVAAVLRIPLDAARTVQALADYHKAKVAALDRYENVETSVPVAEEQSESKLEPGDGSEVEPMAVESMAVESMAVESMAVESMAVESMAVESMDNESSPIESPPIESPPIESPPIESPPIESPPIESSTVKSTVESSTVESSTVESSTVESSTVESSTDESPSTESSADQSPAVEISAVESAALESSSPVGESLESPLSDPKESQTILSEKENHEETMEQSNAVLIQSVESTAEKSQDSGASFAALSVAKVLALINDHPQKDAILLACNQQIIERAFRTVSS